MRCSVQRGFNIRWLLPAFARGGIAVILFAFTTLLLVAHRGLCTTLVVENRQSAIPAA
jgi:hypothetical protein